MLPVLQTAGFAHSYIVSCSTTTNIVTLLHMHMK